MKTRALNKLFAITLILAHLLMLACGDDNPTQSEEPQQPVLPPKASMAIEFDTFQNPSPLAKPSASPGLNFVTAATTVTLVTSAVTLIMSIPIATFAAAISQQPVLQDDGKFHWIFTVTEKGITYQADLAGWIDVATQESVWEMRISVNGGGLSLNNFLWYSGRAAINNSSGYWDVFEPGSNAQVLRIDWQVGEDNSELEFINMKAGAPQNGDILTYQADGTSRSMLYFDNDKGTNLEITWDAVTTAGYIIAPNYNNGEKACWDENRDDVVCP